MELLTPSPPPLTHPSNSLSGFSSMATYRRGFYRTSQIITPQTREIVEEQNEPKVYIAVGKSVNKNVALVQWACKTFGNSEICIFHVLEPSPYIPTLLGRLPATQANAEVVSAFRNAEREEARKLLSRYLNVCCKSKVKASVAVVEAHFVLKGILDFVNKHNIRKLIIGAIPDCVKVKKSSQKASYAATYFPSFCEIFFVYKGKLVWTRQPPDCSSFIGPISANTRAVVADACGLRSQSLKSCKREVILSPERARSSSYRDLLSSGIKSLIFEEGISSDTGLWPKNFSSTSRSNPIIFPSLSISTSPSTDSSCASSAEQMESPDVEMESLIKQLEEASIEYESSRNVAIAEMLKRKKLEAEAVEAMRKVKAFESAHAHEVKLRKEAEVALENILLEKEKLLKEREEKTSELRKATRNIALLDSRTQEANQRCEEITGELTLIHSSIATLRQEKRKLLQQNTEAMNWINRWKNRGKDGGLSSSGECSASPELLEFSPSDLQTATCNFSESFRIGQGGYADVFKGELSDKTVVIKQLHPHNMQQQSQFFEQVEILAKLRHPQLVTLLGVCPEAWCLVYEYIPGRSLQDRLFCKNNVSSMNWKMRARIIAEIASALLFLHSSYPEQIVHGDLRPENMLLDSTDNCKICDTGISSLIPQQTLRCPSFGRQTEPKGLFSYTDPEFHITGALTTKSDIYSFGLVILQILTGRTLAGLLSEVRRAVSCAELESLLDSSAGEWSTYVSRRLAELALQCCEVNSRDRPELTPTLVMELENLHVLEEQSVPSFFLCPIRQDIMLDPQIAADGFTYEGEAIQGWLESGHDTSPMTNLKLSHLELTPNHSLRLAIQDWLCNLEFLT
ncbi:PREDICTED: U-box domain-containing protein 33-like isoform X2 [Nicotiana attenuata]|uniref:U-box domain-containing protein 33-like isoform X2 n=1 Tax=Nicotiana attenuata TaxID=49451 RepID=UPI000904837F|nr:PREDICTED: U-box domain-containing protein 33-like isoform X2 [Nicotiana attenuata]